MRGLRLGTRGSALAQAQSRWVADRLRQLHPGLEVKLVVIETSGDRHAQDSLQASGGPPRTSAASAPNIKAMFVKEIEEALLNGDVDLGVHSAKDLPSALPEGLGIAAYPLREDARDVFISADGRAWKDLPSGATVATSSLRRRIQLQSARPDLAFMPMRGNVDTRLRRLKEAQAAGLILAAAGLKRLGATVPYEPLPVEIIVPAPGQGALAVETALSRRDVRDLLEPLDDAFTRREVELERALMRAMGGGCSTPLGVLARADKGGVWLNAFWSDPDGKRGQRLTGRAGLRPEELSSLIESFCGRLNNPS